MREKMAVTHKADSHFFYKPVMGCGGFGVTAKKC